MFGSNDSGKSMSSSPKLKPQKPDSDKKVLLTSQISQMSQSSSSGSFITMSQAQGHLSDKSSTSSSLEKSTTSKSEKCELLPYFCTLSYTV